METSRHDQDENFVDVVVVGEDEDVTGFAGEDEDVVGKDEVVVGVEDVASEDEGVDGVEDVAGKGATSEWRTWSSRTRASSVWARSSTS